MLLCKSPFLARDYKHPWALTRYTTVYIEVPMDNCVVVFY